MLSLSGLSRPFSLAIRRSELPSPGWPALPWRFPPAASDVRHQFTSHATAAERFRRRGRNCSSMRRDASRSNNFSPHSGQTSSSRSRTSAVLPRTVALTVTICRRTRRLPHVGHLRIPMTYPSTAFFEEIRIWWPTPKGLPSASGRNYGDVVSSGSPSPSSVPSPPRGEGQVEGRASRRWRIRHRICAQVDSGPGWLPGNKRLIPRTGPRRKRTRALGADPKNSGWPTDWPSVRRAATHQPASRPSPLP
jgi:hypothetical protein